ncbi:MAG: hypothetical protein HOV81_17935 [Kofleriaceae bacterium]|nr:hypothetical protein [Kofleriaceae bacterium]
MRRTRAGWVAKVVLGATLASGCANVPVAMTSSALQAPSAINDDSPSTSVVDQCHEDNRCPGGTGTIDAPVAYAVAGTIVAIISVALIKRMLED